MESTLFRFIWKFSKRQQLMVLLLVAASQPFYYYSLDLPKNIINHLTQASKAMAEGKEVFHSVFDYSFDAYAYLALLTVAFLALVIINGAFKYYINVYKGRLGERMLRRLRYVLYEHMLRFPLGYFSRTAPGEVIPIITSETQPVGEFIGDSIAAPAVAGGMLLNTLFFIVMQDPLLALAAVALYPVQMYLIPKLQTKVNQLTRQRTRMIRSMSDRVNESAVSLQEISAHGVARYALAEFSGRLAANYYLRFRIFKLKFFIKFLNNFIAQLTPFFFFSIGGYFVMRGYMSIGALVAVYAAFKEMAPNWRELLDYYQQLKDAEIRYEQIVEQFVPPGMISLERQHGSYDATDTLETELVATGASWINDAGLKTIDGVSLAIKPREHVAVVGPEGGGKHELGLMLSGLADVSNGNVTLGGVDVATLPRGLIARRIGYVTQNTQIFSGSFLDNLVIGLQVRPNPADPTDRAALARRKAEAIEAEITGNSSDDIETDWIDYAAAGAQTREELNERILACLRATDLTNDLRELGLRGTIDPTERPAICEVILQARAALREHLSAPSLRGYFEMFDKDRFNDQASIAENVLFGTPVGVGFDVERLAENPYVQQVLEKLRLGDHWTEIGSQIAAQMVEIFSGLPPGHELLQRYSFISTNELPEYSAALTRMHRQGLAGMKPEERTRFLSLVFRVVPARHRFDVIDQALREEVLQARRLFAQDLPKDLEPHVQFFDVDRYNGAVTLYDNMLFGRLAPGQSQVGSRVREMIVDALQRAGMAEKVLHAVIDVGLDYQVGVGGTRLSAAMRQKLGVARALLKQPAILILDDPLSVLETSAQGRVVDQVLAASKERSVLWSLQRTQFSKHFARVLVVVDGRIAEQGSFEELNRPATLLHKQLAAD